MWDLIVSVPDHCLSFYFVLYMWGLIVSVPDHCLSFYFSTFKNITFMNQVIFCPNDFLKHDFIKMSVSL